MKQSTGGRFHDGVVYLLADTMEGSRAITGIRGRAAHHAKSLREEPGSAAFLFFCLFVCSYLLHLGTRVPVLGSIRVDLILAASALIGVVLNKGRVSARGAQLNDASKWLLVLILYICVSTPFVEWPGSVMRHGLEPFAKAAVFYVLAVGTLTTRRRLMVFLLLLAASQSIRILEPLYLHLTQGYWGSVAHTEGWQVMNRLSGAPSDSINPNGLAFIVVTTLPLMAILIGRSSKFGALLSLTLVPVYLYVLVLTGSRSGFIVVVVALFAITWRAKHRWVAIAAATAFLAYVLGGLSGLQQDRFRSIVDSDVQGAATAQGRIDGVWRDFKVAMNRPVLGHGLGTSAEAAANAGFRARPSHNLVTEVLQELGLVGLVIFLRFLWAAARGCLRALRETGAGSDMLGLRHAAEAMSVTMLIGAIFGLASYGLSELYWYLWAGVCVAISRIAQAGGSSGAKGNRM